MSFAERTGKEQKFVALMSATFWQQPPCRDRLLPVPFGQETHVLREAMQALRYVRTTTALHIRYAPDFFLLDRQHPDRVYMLEYKCSFTPLRSQGRITQVATKLGNPRLQSSDIGNWEEAAYDNYICLHNAGVRVAVVYYCAYHPRKLLCDYVDALGNQVFKFQVGTQTTYGSRTPAINFDINTMRSLEDFLVQEHGISAPALTPVTTQLKAQLATALPEER
jgi:hypothetical protein